MAYTDTNVDDILAIASADGHTPEETAQALRRWQGGVLEEMHGSVEPDAFMRGQSRLDEQIATATSTLANRHYIAKAEEVIPDVNERIVWQEKLNARHRGSDGNDSEWTPEDQTRFDTINRSFDAPAWNARRSTVAHRLDINGAEVGTLNLDLGASPGETSIATIAGKGGTKHIAIPTPSQKEVDHEIIAEVEKVTTAKKEAADLRHTLLTMPPNEGSIGMVAQAERFDGFAKESERRISELRNGGIAALVQERVTQKIKDEPVADKELDLGRGILSATGNFFKAIPIGAVKASVNTVGGLGDIASIAIGDNALVQWRKENIHAIEENGLGGIIKGLNVNPRQRDTFATQAGDVIGQILPVVAASLTTSGAASAIGTANIARAESALLAATDVSSTLAAMEGVSAARMVAARAIAVNAGVNVESAIAAAPKLIQSASQATAAGTMLPMGAAIGSDLGDHYQMNPEQKRAITLAGMLVMPVIELASGGTLHGKAAAAMMGVAPAAEKSILTETLTQGAKMAAIGASNDLAVNLVGAGPGYTGEMPNPFDLVNRARDFALGAIPGGLMAFATHRAPATKTDATNPHPILSIGGKPFQVPIEGGLPRPVMPELPAVEVAPTAVAAPPKPEPVAPVEPPLIIEGDPAMEARTPIVDSISVEKNPSGNTIANTTVTEFESDLTLGHMSADEQTEATRFARQIGADVPAAIAEYNQRFGKHVSADNARELDPMWQRSKEDRQRLSGALGVPAGKLAQLVFDHQIAQLHDADVYMLAGGQASGKTSSTKADSSAASLIYDNTFSNPIRAESNIEKALAGNNRVTVHFVYKPLEESIIGAIDRANSENGRVELPGQMARTHLASQRTFLGLAEKYRDNPNVTFKVTDYTGNIAKPSTVEELAGRAYNQPVEEIQSHAISVADEYLAAHSADFDQGFKDRFEKALGGRSPRGNDGKPSTVESQVSSPAGATGDQTPQAGLAKEEVPAPATSTKNATVDAEREARGEKPIMKTAAQGWGEAWGKAMHTIEKDGEAGRKLVAEINQKPRALNDAENALLLHEKISKRHVTRTVINEINATTDVQKKAELQLRLAEHLTELNQIDNATKAAGTETGRGLNARKMMRDEDDSLENTLSLYRAAKGEDLSPVETARVEHLHKQLDAAKKEVDAHEDKASDHEATQAVLAFMEDHAKDLSAKAKAARQRLIDNASRPPKRKPSKLSQHSDGVPDRADATPDMVDFARSHNIKRPPPQRVNKMGELTNKGAGEHDALRSWAKDNPTEYRAFTKESGLGTDHVADADGLVTSAIGAGLLPDGATVTDLVNRLRADIASRRTEREQAAANDASLAHDEAEHIAADKIEANDLKHAVADQFESHTPKEDIVKNALKAMREAAKARLDEQRAKGELYSDALGPLGVASLRMTRDHVIIGASHLAEIGLDFARWSKAVIKEFGDLGETALRTLFDRSKIFLDQSKHDITERVAALERAATPSGVAEKFLADVKSGKTDAVNLSPKLAQDLAKAYVIEGVDTIQELVAKVHADAVKWFPELTLRDVRDAITDYGKTSEPSKDQIAKTLRELKSQGKLLSSLEDANSGIAPPKQGFLRGKPSETVRKLREQVKDVMRKMGIETDGKKQLASARDAIVSRLKNQVSDLNNEIAGKAKQRPTRDAIPYDEEMNALKKEREELQAYVDDLTGPSPEGKWNALTERAAKASAENYRRRIAQGDLHNDPGTAHTPTARTKAALDDAAAAKAEWEALRETAGITTEEATRDLNKGIARQIKAIEDKLAGKPKPEPSTPAKADAETYQLRKELERLRELDKATKPTKGRTPKQLADAAEKAADKQIAEIEAELATGKQKAKAQGAEFIPDAQLRAKMAELESLRGIRDEARRAKIPKRDPEELALARAHKRIDKSIADAEKKLASKDFAKAKPKAKLKVDEDHLAKQSKLEEIRLKIKREVFKLEQSKRPLYYRVLDGIVHWQRSIGILSGTNVLMKLSAAAGWNMGFMPLQQIAGEAWRRILPGIAAQSPREGAGFNVKLEANVVKTAFMALIKESGRIMKRGKSDLDLKHGKIKPHDLDQSWMDYFVYTHLVLKNPVKQAEFARSYQNRLQWHMDQGLPSADPYVQLRAATDAYRESVLKGKAEEAAYVDGKRAILMQDNFISNALNHLFTSLENQKKGSPSTNAAAYTVGKFGRALLPVVKVPSNYVANTVNAVIGVPRAVMEVLYHKLTKGIEAMEPAEADAVLRHAKQGSVGLAMLLYGFLNPQTVGGYHTTGEKRDEEDVHHGTFKVGGWEVPHLLAHHPMLEAMQFGATTRRVLDGMNRAGREPLKVPVYKGYSPARKAAAMAKFEARVKEREDKEIEARSITAAMKASAFGLLGDLPMIRGGGTLDDLFNGGSQGIKAWTRLGKSFIVPAGLRDLSGYIDFNDEDWFHGKPRIAKGFKEEIQKDIPFWRESLPEKASNHH